jgi:YHS domain-containing protein
MQRASVAVQLGCAVGVAMAAWAGPAQAEGAVNTGYFGGVAIMGYDPVAYFTEGRARKGSKEFAYDWLGTPWYFATAEHRDLFISDPAKYAPQYGGYCVGEVAYRGATVNIDPEAWRIINGKLYLSYDKGFATEFEAHADEYLVKADANWPSVQAELKKQPYN